MNTNTMQKRTALITGVSQKKGIGYGIAKRLASQGINLFLQSFASYHKEQDPGEREMILEKLREHNIKAEFIEADFMKPESPARVIQAAVKKFSHVDILIINHTHDTQKTMEELTADEIDRHLIIDVRASLLLIQAYRKQHDGRPGGRIILLTSGQHLGPMPHPAYVASKGALQ